MTIKVYKKMSWGYSFIHEYHDCTNFEVAENGAITSYRFAASNGMGITYTSDAGFKCEIAKGE